MSKRLNARIAVQRDTREEFLKPLKRGGEGYDELLRKMATQYEPEEPTAPPEVTE